MSDPRPRPRAFRLDDAGVAFDGRPTAEAPRAEVRTETAPIPDNPRPSRSTRARRRSRPPPAPAAAGGPRSATLAWTGLGGLVSLALGPVDRRSPGVALAQGAGARLARRRLRRAVPVRRRRPRRAARSPRSAGSAASPGCTPISRSPMPATTARRRAPPSPASSRSTRMRPRPRRPAPSFSRR